MTLTITGVKSNSMHELSYAVEIASIAHDIMTRATHYTIHCRLIDAKFNRLLK